MQLLNYWDVSNVINMSGMFAGGLNEGTINSFNQDISSWNFNNEVNLDNFLSASSMSTENYDLLLERFQSLGLENKQLGAHNLTYCDVIVRDILTEDLGWYIYDDDHLVNCNTPLPSGAFVTRWQVDSSDGDSYPNLGRRL
ncbi:BspA family leucine-rich repeat surface protein [Mesonia ostreae]|uniref:BspA family leucine-rich repeat surface protein n=1 Tax=Mesonia ostreae TaxID=861110 RepID=A0ABU2KHR1_9FLAO|nr:BspA family leucine-rich repeat surface protein [Mesonia ostreae]MDT0294203.1 BspA family leucine-rich repeat surface protein [Mesonia ostreae]